METRSSWADHVAISAKADPSLSSTSTPAVPAPPSSDERTINGVTGYGSQQLRSCNDAKKKGELEQLDGSIKSRHEGGLLEKSEPVGVMLMMVCANCGNYHPDHSEAFCHPCHHKALLRGCDCARLIVIKCSVERYRKMSRFERDILISQQLKRNSRFASICTICYGARWSQVKDVVNCSCSPRDFKETGKELFKKMQQSCVFVECLLPPGYVSSRRKAPIEDTRDDASNEDAATVDSEPMKYGDAAIVSTVVPEKAPVPVPTPVAAAPATNASQKSKAIKLAELKYNKAVRDGRPQSEIDDLHIVWLELEQAASL